MPERYLKRSSGLQGNESQRNTANTIRVDSTSNLLKHGTGTSGAVEKTVQTLDGIPPIVVTASTLSLTAAAHAGQIVNLQNVAGQTVTLPAATGSGAIYRLFVGLSLTSGSLVIQVASSSDYLRGQAWTIGAANSGFATANTGTLATESDTITANRTTTGLGTIGDYYEFVDLETNVWAVEADYASSGTAATPFSAAV